MDPNETYLLGMVLSCPSNVPVVSRTAISRSTCIAIRHRTKELSAKRQRQKCATKLTWQTMSMRSETMNTILRLENPVVQNALGKDAVVVVVAAAVDVHIWPPLSHSQAILSLLWVESRNSEKAGK